VSITVPTLLLLAALALGSCGGRRKAGLEIEYGDKGLQRLSFGGVVLEDLEEFPSDAFHIWHMQAQDAKGEVLKKPQYGWGELNSGRSWDARTHTCAYRFEWGSISARFAQEQDILKVFVNTKNNPGSGVTLDGATIYPFVLHFPKLPIGFGEANYAYLAVNPSDPTPVAKVGNMSVGVIAETGGKPLYRGFEPTGSGPNYTVIVSSTPMDSLAASYPRLGRPVAPGAEDSFEVSIHFEQLGTEQ
jgi:hypothetical protein